MERPRSREAGEPGGHGRRAEDGLKEEEMI